MATALALAGLFKFQGLLWRNFLAVLGVMMLLTVVFDNVIIGLHIVAYVRVHITGILAGKAPIEDFAYTITAVFLLPVMWNVMKGKYASKDR